MRAAAWRKMEGIALHRELRFRGFPYGSESLRSVCVWATSIGHSCLDDFHEGEALASKAGAGAFNPNVLRYIEDVLKVLPYALSLELLDCCVCPQVHRAETPTTDSAVASVSGVLVSAQRASTSLLDVQGFFTLLFVAISLLPSCGA